jgi:hypothetical protein
MYAFKISSLSVSWQRFLTQERSLEITISLWPNSPMLILSLSLKLAVRLESPGQNSQLRCSAGCPQDNPSARATHRKHSPAIFACFSVGVPT